MNNAMLFFCANCSGKTKEKTECTVKHSIKTFKQGEYLAHQGDEVSHLFLLSQGSVTTEMVSDSGVGMPIETIEAPYPLAAAFIFADHNHFPVDVVALGDCEVVVISKEAVEKQMAKCPAFLRGFIAFNANRMQFLSERLKIFSQKGIKAKLAYYILKRDKQGNFEIGRSITSLADYFGVERPSLSRAISEMIRDGIIDLNGGVGRIISYHKIKELL